MNNWLALQQYKNHFAVIWDWYFMCKTLTLRWLNFQCTATFDVTSQNLQTNAESTDQTTKSDFEFDYLTILYNDLTLDLIKSVWNPAVYKT